MILNVHHLPGLTNAVKSWVVRVFNTGRLSKVDALNTQSPPQYHPRNVSHVSESSVRAYSSLVTKSSIPRVPSRSSQLLYTRPSKSRAYHQFYKPRSAPKSPRINLHSTTFFLRPQIGAFPKSPWTGISRFHTSPASNAIVINQIAHSVSTSLRNGLHPPTKVPPPIKGQILAQVAARAACQTNDSPAGYIRFTLSPPAWTPTDTDLSDPDIIKALDTHITELQRIKKALQKLKQYGDYPIRTVIPSKEVATMDVLFRGATAEDVKRWNQNEFRLGTGRVAADTVFCAGRFEDVVRWSEVLGVEKMVEKEMNGKADAGLLKFWEELNMLEGRIR